ncbi:RadB family lipoprotein [Fusobacterium polymorphum]|uniref:RadB family lipoprotein n=1 Tax=Fusobacterium nucleatum subsp. polymorphum TaxID=76857 RepID=UPI0030D203FB
MKKGIFAMFILMASMAMVACTGANKSTTNEGAVGENDAFKALERRREYYKEQDKEQAKAEVEAKKAMSQAETTTEAVVTVDDAQAAKAKEEADKEALKILEKKRKGN